MTGVGPGLAGAQLVAGWGVAVVPKQSCCRGQWLVSRLVSHTHTAAETSVATSTEPSSVGDVQFWLVVKHALQWGSFQS